MKCPKCGYSLPEDSEFCQYCGIRLEFQPSTDISPQKATAPTEAAPPVEPITAPISETIPTPPQPKADSEESLFSRAYDAYLSDDPDKKQFFKSLLGGQELKKAYLEECARTKKEYDSGVRHNYKQTYTDFMGVLYNTYVRGTPTMPMADSLPNEKSEIASEPIVPTIIPENKDLPIATPASGSANTSNGSKKQTYCKKCGSAIDSNTKKCDGCGKQYFRAKTTIPILTLSVLLVLSVGLNTLQYLQGTEAAETIASQATEINNIKRTITSQTNQITSQSNTIASHKRQITSLQKTQDNYDRICDALRIGNLGYATSNFNSSESIILVKKNETNRKFTINAGWPYNGKVFVTRAGTSASVSFDSDTWYTSTQVTINPQYAGVTTVAFRNTVDSEAFKVLIIVID